MTTNLLAVAREMNDGELIQAVHAQAAFERDSTARVVALLAEMDARRLYLGAGCSSMFTYCTEVLHFSEHAAYGRIEAARAARRFPVILEVLMDGSIHLTAVSLLASHLTPDNHLDVLGQARHKSKRQLEELVVALRPRPDATTVLRRLPSPARAQFPPVSHAVPVDGNARAERRTTSDRIEAPVAHPASPAHPARPARIEPLAPERFKLQVTISRETHDKLRSAHDLMRHVYPDGDLASVLDRALTLLVTELQRSKCAASRRPREVHTRAGNSRHVPAQAVRREVWRRDAGQCAFVGTAGRCSERGFLEYHHLVPYADGGECSVANLELRCRAHNLYEAEQWNGVVEALGDDVYSPG